MVPRKGGENGDGCGTLGVEAGGAGSGHPWESGSGAGQGKGDAGGCTWGVTVLRNSRIRRSLVGTQPAACQLPFVSTCSVVPKGSYDHFQCFLEAFVFFPKLSWPMPAGQCDTSHATFPLTLSSPSGQVRASGCSPLFWGEFQRFLDTQGGGKKKNPRRGTCDLWDEFMLYGRPQAGPETHPRLLEYR